MPDRQLVVFHLLQARQNQQSVNTLGNIPSQRWTDLTTCLLYSLCLHDCGDISQHLTSKLTAAFAPGRHLTVCHKFADEQEPAVRQHAGQDPATAVERANEKAAV